MTHKPLAAYSGRLGLFTALASLAIVTPSVAQSVWTGSTNNEFGESTNWSPALPGANDTATVNTGSPQVTNNIAIDRLGIDGGAVTITNTGELTTTSGTTITSGSLGINSGGILNSDVDLNGGNLFIDGALNGELSLNAGNVVVNGTLGSATVGDTTSLSNNGSVGDVSISAGGTFTNNSSATVDAVTNAGTASNAGTIGSLENKSGNFTNNAGGTISGNTLVSGGTVTNNFVVTDVDVAAAAAFTNNSGATAGNVRNLGTTDNAGTIVSLRNEAGTFTNNLGGIVSGTTTVSGGTVINNFVVTDVDVAAAAAFVNNGGATAGNVRNAGTVDNSGTVASLRNTAGNFTNNAGGNITGNTVIDGGAVTNNFVVNDVDVAAAAAFINNNGATARLVTNSGNLTNSGTINSLRNNGGLFTNNGSGSVTGATIIEGGNVVNNATLASVEIGRQGRFTNNSGALAGAVTNAGMAANDGTIASLINEDGYFSNTGTISGAVDLTGGELANLGSVAGTIDISSGGLLSGSGSVGGMNVNAGGILAPGPGIQTTTVSGNLTFQNGSIYQVDVGATGISDRIDVAGAVAINGGTLNIRAASGSYNLTNDYRILTAGTLTGTFDSISSDFAFLTPSPTYGPTAIDLALDRNNVRFSEVAATSNDRSTASAVENLGPASPIFSTVLALDTPTAQRVFSQLNGEVHASLQSALLWQSTFVGDAVLDNINRFNKRQPIELGGLSFWMSGTYAENHMSNMGTARSTDNQIGGALVGMDMAVSNNWRLGGVAGYSTISTYQASAESYHAGLYAAGEFGPLQITGGTVFSRNDVSTKRDIGFGIFADRLTADYASRTTHLFGDVAWTFEVDDIELQPFANLAYTDIDTEDFTERGGAAALRAWRGSNETVASTFGMRWSADMMAGDIPLVASGMLGWRHAWGDRAASSYVAFENGSPFMLEGVTTPQDSLVVKAGLTANLSKATRLSLSYSGEFASGFRSNAAHANLTVDF